MTWYVEMLNALREIARSPFFNTDALWLLVPVFILWIVFEIYFDLHKTEPLGWNSALGNGVSMFWIGMNLMTFLFTNERHQFTWMRFSAVMVIVGYSLFIAYISFAHKFNAKTVFMLAAPTPIYYISAVTIVWAYGSLIMTGWILLDLMIIFPFVIGIEVLIRHFTSDRDAGKHDDTQAPSDIPDGPTQGIPGQDSGQGLPDDFKF